MFALETEVKVIDVAVGVVKAMDKAHRKAVKRSGAVLRGFIRRKLQRRTKTGLRSRPGRPPRNQAGKAFGLSWVKYNYDDVFIETEVYPMHTRGQDVPAILEYGGRTKMKARNGQITFVPIAKRPWVGPATKEFKGKYPELWKGIIQ